MGLEANPRIANSIYELVYNEEDARACSEIPASACRVSPTNFVVLLVSYFLTRLGDAIANPKTVLPWVLTNVGAPVSLLGFLVPIRESGSLLPQLVIAGYVRAIAVRKWVWVSGSVIQACSLVGIGAVALGLRGAVAGFAILALLVVFSLARGLCSVAAKDVLGKTIDKGRRGRLNGWSTGAAGLVTVGLGAALVALPPAHDSAQFYAFALFGAAALWLAAAFVYAQVREFPGAVEGGRNALGEALSRLGILLRDKPFRQFVIARSLMLCSALSAPYLVALGQQQIGDSGMVLGAFVIASGVGALFGAPVWGRFADRSSRDVMVTASSLAAAVCIMVTGVAVLAPAVLAGTWFLPLAYFSLSLAHDGVRVARKTYIVDLADGDKRTDYVSVSNSVIGLVLLGTGLIGVLASFTSIVAVILVLALMGIAGAAVAARLPDPG